MTQTERMNAGMIYDPGSDEIMSAQVPYQVKLREFNALAQTDYAGKEKYMKEVFAECGENCYIELPFYANWGGHHVHFGSNVYANFGLTLVDDGEIFVGDRVLFGPHVTVATANHPVNPELREKSYQYNKDVHIGRNVWIGANTVIVPGVTIGENCVIGAGSVVTKDIPPNTVAVGNPCRVLREIGDRDDEFFYKEEIIDEEMKEMIKEIRNGSAGTI
ncbi:MAG: sugar O-acetyltransferase [Clostridia bacterium]|nr:sugar O-acetyltransferase [Clostridia bacterium]